ncbi:group II truncated hemoglobin [Pseudonocardia kunmingensis]|uniref:Hemoglobin n=1 Tax=Pseudonocardia kunmingensis TaxID=630975 RepID=A0A543DJ89_9PSEU|nr:group II truncated hemoglobin [Pseudonocardia kunmingensis]TQM09397.1 hemoglobin [Pseudonocardia kunmingensis]
MSAPDAGTAESLYEHAGGHEGLHRAVEAWYPTVLADPLLAPLFGEGRPSHVGHLTAFFAEVFGGPRTYTDELGGFPAVLEAHRGLRIREDQRQRFVELFIHAADRTGLPDDRRFRDALHAYLEFGTEVAVQNSHASADDQLHPCQEVPRWDW